MAWIQLKWSCIVTTLPIDPTWQPATQPTVPLLNRTSINPRELRATIKAVELLIRCPDHEEVTTIECLQIRRHNEVIYYLTLELRRLIEELHGQYRRLNKLIEQELRLTQTGRGDHPEYHHPLAG